MNSKSHKKKKVDLTSLNESLNFEEMNDENNEKKDDFREIFSFENIRNVMNKVESLEEDNKYLSNEVQALKKELLDAKKKSN